MSNVFEELEKKIDKLIVEVGALRISHQMILEALQPSREYHNGGLPEGIGIPIPGVIVKEEFEDVRQNLTDVFFYFKTEKAWLVIKNGYQKWVPFSLIEEPKEAVIGFQGNIILTEEAEKWVHKKPWDKFVPKKQSKGG